MLKWFSGEEGDHGSGGPGSPTGAAAGDEVAMAELLERLAQTEQLVSQLKEMIREKDAALLSKDEQIKVEKETCEAKLSKLRLQNKAKVTSLTTQLEELKKQHSSPDTPKHSRRGASEGGDQANRGKIVLLKKKVEELEQNLAQKEKELEKKEEEVESQRQRGEEMDAMLTEKSRKLADKEAYIIHLQTATAAVQPFPPASHEKVTEEGGAMQELQLLVQNLTKKVGESEERYSLLQEQTDSLKELLATEKEQYIQKESMYKQNIQTFKDIILQKDNQLTEINQMHEQELFKLAAKSDASADLEQLLKALKQKLHEKEEVLLGKTQVIDVLQGEVDGRDQQIKELKERLWRQQVERESLESKMEAEKHVMRAQVRDLMEKQQAEVQRLTEQHQALMADTQQNLQGQLDALRRAAEAAPSACQETSGAENLPADSASIQRITELEAQTKQKIDEASRSEAKFLKMKAWSKSRIRQLEEELKKSQAGIAPPDMTTLRSRVTALEVEREENLWKVEHFDELKAKSDMLEAKLVVYEEQQRTLQAELEQFTKRATSQASESGSADDTQSQVLEWQEMVAEAVSARDRAREEKAAMTLRINHMEEEREALATRQQELEEELAQTRGLGQHRAKKLAMPAERSLQEDFEFDGQAPFQDPRSTSESTTPMEGENMGGWWPEYSTPDTDGLRSVVEELELERNQLQEQILNLEERCQDLEDRLQLQARIEALQNESEKLQTQLASVRSQQSRDAEKHQLLVNSLNQQVKGLSDTQECLETSLIEKENTLAQTSEKLELISVLRESLIEKDIQYKEVSEKLLQTEQTLETISKKSSISEKKCSELKTEVIDLTQKLSLLKDKMQKQNVTMETLQTELDQTNEELDKLNTAHLEERAQLIHDLQSCEREIDSMKDILSEKDKEILALSGNMREYAEQVTMLKRELKLKEESLVQVENALSKAEREAMIIKESQNSDQHTLNCKITELDGKLKDIEMELVKAREESTSKGAEVEQLIKQGEEDNKTIQALRGETQKHILSYSNHLAECETCIASLKDQLALSTQKVQESEAVILQYKDKNDNNDRQLIDKEQAYESELKFLKDEQNKLLAQVEKYHIEVELMSKQLEAKTQAEESIKKEMEKKLKTMSSLESQLKAFDEQAEHERQKFNTDLEARDSENQKLSKEIQSKSENVLKLKNLIKNTKAEKAQLQEKLSRLTKELEVQKGSVTELNENITSAHELNRTLEKEMHSVRKENERLVEEATERVRILSDVTAERDSLKSKVAILETEYSESKKMVQNLEKDKNDLNARTNELSKVLEESAHSNSEILLTKTEDCNNLTQLVREKEHVVTQLQEQVQSFISKIDKLQHDMKEKRRNVSDLEAQIEAQRSHQAELQEALSLAHEQERTLKSHLMDKDALLNEKEEEYKSLQNEFANQKDAVSKLLMDIESLNLDHTNLKQQLVAKEETLKDVTKQGQLYKDELDDANKKVKSSSDQITVMGENAKKLESDAKLKEAELNNLKSQIQTLTEEKQQLYAACESRELELTHQLDIGSKLDRQLKVACEENTSLSLKITSLAEDNKRLEAALSQNLISVSELNSETKSLNEKISWLQGQISDNQKTTGDLSKEKELLIVEVNELRQVLKEIEITNSARLLEKTAECDNLSRTLKERAEQLQNLYEQMDCLKVQVCQVNMVLNEKEQMLSEKTSQLEAQQNQLLQFQDTISMLQEQGSVLNSALLEKDKLFEMKAEECSILQNEVTLQKDLVSQIHVEVESLKKECLEKKQLIEQKEQILQEVTNDFDNSKHELKKQSQSVVSLTGQLCAVNKNFAEMEAEATNLKDAVHKLSADKCQLKQEEDLRKAEVVDLKDGMQVLNDCNAKLGTELQKSLSELSEAHNEITHLKSEVHNWESQFKAARFEREQLNMTMEEKDHSLKEQVNVIQQLKSSMAEQVELLKEKADDNVRLTAQVAELEDSACKLRAQVEGFSSETTTIKSILEKTELPNLEHQNSSSEIVANLISSLQAKEEECQSLKERISHLEESVAKLSSTLQVNVSEAKSLKKVLEEKEAGLSELSKSLQDFKRRADEALLFKTQFMESTEMMSQLQGQIQVLTTETETHRMLAEETQSAFNNLQDKYAANLEELQDVRKQLSQSTDKVSSLQKLLDDTTNEHQTGRAKIETLSNELSSTQQKFVEMQDLNSCLSKEKDEAFASHQASVSLLTVEIERLKSQHHQVVTQMNALTENLEQREMALHAINSQYMAQAKHTAQLVSEIQKLEVQNKRSLEEISRAKEEHQRVLTAVSHENTQLKEGVRKLLTEKEELERRHHHVLESQGEMEVLMEQQSSNISQIMEELVSEKERSKAKVSAQDEEMSHLKENVQKLEQILQDAEKEWLLVLDKEKQDKNVLEAQVKKIENEMKSKDLKVNALKHELDSLQGKLGEASAKQLEASASSIQLERLLASVQEKENENNHLQNALLAVKQELQNLTAKQNVTEKDSSVSSAFTSDTLGALDEEKAHLMHMFKQVEASHESEVDALKIELEKTLADLQMYQDKLGQKERIQSEKLQQIDVLQDRVEHLQTQLNCETQRAKEATVKYTTLQSECHAKDDQIACMQIQISQQKEFLSGLSQQLKDKDASISKVIESASNERVKLDQEKSSLSGQLENVKHAYQSSMKQLEDLSLQVEEEKSHLRRELEARNAERLELVKENDGLKVELSRVSKEKDAMKKKLQAAIILRKDLLKKVEEYENQNESLKCKTEISLLQERLQESTNQAQATAKLYDEKMCLLKSECFKKEGEILDCKAENERLLEQLKLENQNFQSALTEKNILIKQLQVSVAEVQDAFEQYRNSMAQKAEERQTPHQIDLQKDETRNNSPSASAVLDLEKELTQVKQEKVMLQKKAQAALLARKESLKKAQVNENKLIQELTELKDDYKALLEQHCQLTNELNDVQLNFAEKAGELEDIRKTSLSYQEDLDTLKQVVEERDKTVQDLKMSLAEKESQCHSLPDLQKELESVKSKIESTSLEIERRDEALKVMEEREETLSSKLCMLESDLEKAYSVIKAKAQEVKTYKERTEAAERTFQEEKEALFNEKMALEGRLNTSESSLQEYICANEEKYQTLMEENKTLSDQVFTSQKQLTETKQRLSEQEIHLIEVLEKAQLQYKEKERDLEVVQHEKENSSRIISELRAEISTTSQQLKLFKQEQLRQDTLEKNSRKTEDVNEDKVPSTYKYGEDSEAKLHHDDALFVLQAEILQKNELIAALQMQLEQQIKIHERAQALMKLEAQEHQQQDAIKVNEQDNQSKISLLTRKLQAALVSRKELLKENANIKEEMEKLSTKHDTKEAEYADVKASVLKLKQQNQDLESTVICLNTDKDELRAEVHRITNDNRNLSAACESLKQTIENITQQKKAFSCQLESLKDSDTEDLTKWKSKHADLKQDYESLLQAYENVGSEMDKMRQLLEGAKRDRQEALKKLHKSKTEMEILQKQAGEMEDENQSIKQKMHKFSKEKKQKIEELEEENQEISKQLKDIEESHKMAICELMAKNQGLETEICHLKESSEHLQGKLKGMLAENSQLAEKLKEATCSSEKKHLESKSFTTNMQLKLDEALSLNSSLTAQIQAQKTELGAQMEASSLLKMEKQDLSEKIETIRNDHELQLQVKDDTIKELKDIINKHSQETISLKENVKILEDDKSLLQEELENVQEISDKVKNENEYLETVILKNSERIDELTESVTGLQTQNSKLSSQLEASKEMSDQVRQEKEGEQLKLVREFEAKLKAVQRGKEGSKNINKDLQELLKEKHQEINQLQQNCIRYQEVILELESSLKVSESACESFEKEQRKSSLQVSVVEDKVKQVETELATCKTLLQEATEKVDRVQSERDHLALEMSQLSKKSEDQLSDQSKSQQNEEEKQINSSMENQVWLQQQIDDLKDVKDRETQRANELKKHIDSQELQMMTLKRAFETNEAKLSALSSTPQGSEATKLWNDLYQNTLHEKDSQLLEQGFVIKRFLDDMRVKEKEVNELRVTKSRLERTLNEYSVASAAQQRQLFVMSASNAELAETVDLMTAQVKELSAQVESTEQDRSMLNRRLADKEDEISQVRLNLQQIQKTNADTDAQLLFLQSRNDKLQVDLEKQEGITLQLKTLLQSKDSEISSLLSSRDGHMSGYLEQLQANHRAQVAVYEDRLASLHIHKEKTDKELRGLEAKIRNLQINMNRSIQEKEQMAAKTESFKNSVVSLQSEKERLMSEYRILEAKSQLKGLKGKEGSPDGEAGATKGLKHEIRKLLHQMDDLNSENAMLRAQLVRYREDLNQVLSLKDNQLKVLLKKQQDVIKNLENQKATTEKQHRESQLELQKEAETRNALNVEISKFKTQVSILEGEILTQKTTNEGKVITDLQQAVVTKAAECNDLQQKLVSQKTLTDELKEKMQLLEKETDKKLADAEVKYNSEVNTFEHEVELMRKMQETADQRVAQLAEDLVETEQQLSEAKTQNANMGSKNESLRKAMIALQNDRDQLIEDFKILRNRYDEELRETQASYNKAERSLQEAVSDLAMLAKERDVLIHKVKALESKDSNIELNKLLDDMSKSLTEKEKQLKQAVLENDTYSRQLSAFSKSMASLQNDRDRLVDELAGATPVVEARQWSSPSASTSAEKSKGSAVSVFQSDRNWLTSELQQTVHEIYSNSSRAETSNLRSEKKETPLVKETAAPAGQSILKEAVSQLESERIQLHKELQRCMYEIQQRDQYIQQLNLKLQQTTEEKAAVAAQFKAVSQTLRDMQDRCHWLESQFHVQTQQGSINVEVAPGAPQERSNQSIIAETAEASQLRERLLEMELCLSDERARRETVEEALRLAEDRVKSIGSSLSRDKQRDFSIEMETDEEWEALTLNPNQPLITRKVKGGMVACRRWLRGRSLYFSRLLTGRARSRYFFMAYLLTLHMLFLMCLFGAL